jgi:hypothetical protein
MDQATARNDRFLPREPKKVVYATKTKISVAKVKPGD